MSSLSCVHFVALSWGAVFFAVHRFFLSGDTRDQAGKVHNYSHQCLVLIDGESLSFFLFCRVFFAVFYAAFFGVKVTAHHHRARYTPRGWAYRISPTTLLALAASLAVLPIASAEVKEGYKQEKD